MSITLAATWFPRGELPRFSRLLPMLEQYYARLVICYIPNDDPSIQEQFTVGAYATNPKICFCLNEDRKRGRFLAIERALENPANFVHYADMDRLLHWVETRPHEWISMLEQIKQHDCIIFGRTEAAMRTHPQALIVTEQASNRVVSHLLGVELGQSMDVSAGSKSFSCEAATYLVEHGDPANSIGTDAEWPILLKRAGFSLEYIPVDGLDWESADQFKLQAATRDEQQQAAVKYDADSAHWSTRVEIADQIIRTAIEASQNKAEARMIDKDRENFDPKLVFEVEDYLYFYRESLTDERADREVGALVSLLELEAPKKILDLACGFGRHTNRLAALGHSMTGIDLTPGFLDLARQDAKNRQVDVIYHQGDMREIAFKEEFDRVTLLFTAFGYFSDEENLQVLENMCHALKPGGLLLFDTFNRDVFLQGMKPFIVSEKDGNLMIDRQSFDSLTGRYYNRRIVIRDGVRKDKPYFVRLYNPTEIQALLTQAGLELYHIYGNWEGKGFSSDDRRMVIIARKPD